MTTILELPATPVAADQRETAVSIEDDDFLYIGIDAEGLCVCMVVDDQKYKRDTAKRVAQWIREGKTISRVPRAAGIERMNADWPRVKARREARSEGRRP